MVEKHLDPLVGVHYVLASFLILIFGIILLHSYPIWTNLVNKLLSNAHLHACTYKSSYIWTSTTSHRNNIFIYFLVFEVVHVAREAMAIIVLPKI